MGNVPRKGPWHQPNKAEKNGYVELRQRMNPRYLAYLNWVAWRMGVGRKDILERMVLEFYQVHPFPDAPPITNNPKTEPDYREIDLYE